MTDSHPRPSGHLIGVYSWNEGGPNKVSVLSLGQERRFNSPAEAMAFLRRLPIHAFVRPTNLERGGLPVLEVVIGHSLEDILKAAEAALNSDAGSLANHFSLFSQAPEDELKQCFADESR